MIFIVLLVVLSFKPIAAQPWQICGATATNYTTNSTYHANLQLLSAMLTDNATTSPYHFAKGSVGAAPDTVYGLALCRGDTSNSTCHACVATAFRDAQKQCVLSKGATIFYDPCILSFSDTDFLPPSSNTPGPDPFLIMLNTQNLSMPLLPGWDPSNPDSTSAITDLIVGRLLQQTAEQAAYDSTMRYYGTGRMNFGNPFTQLYSLAQCTPDLTPSECMDCFNGISRVTTQYFSGKEGGKIFGVRCNFRYEVYLFYNGNPMRYIEGIFLVPSKPGVPPPAPLVVVPSDQHKRGKSNVLIISLVVPLLASFFCVVIFFGYRRLRKGKRSVENDMIKDLENEAPLWEMEGRSSEFTLYDFSQILEATNNFSEENKLGQGGFGPVYKGQFTDKLDIAVKRLDSDSGQGLTEFKNEVHLIAKLQHTNLVRLFGCCTQGDEKILIYEYLPNKSLDFFIFDETRRDLLDWSKRLVIIEGIAQGLLYLHKHSRLRVIHRDLKASNILLDHEMNPKISDFGLAKIFSTTDNEGNTKRIVGTYGYMAPEYASEGLFSIKSDVFSFGVLLLEILSGKKTSSFHGYGDFINLLGHAWQLWKDGRWLELMDASLVTGYHMMEMMRCTNIALLCVQESAADRPTMSDVVVMLSTESMSLPEPKYPAYFHIRVGQEEASTIVVEPSSLNDVTLSGLDGR